jgi:hypothetical protein
MGKGIFGKIKDILGKKSGDNSTLENDGVTSDSGLMSIEESLGDLEAPQFRTDDQGLRAMLQAQAKATLPVSGTEGDISWSISEDMVLTISPTDSAKAARMANYCNPLLTDPDMSPNAVAPWLQEKKGIVITHLVIEEGIMNIGSNSFATCEFLEDVQLPSSLTSIGEASFSDCTSLKKIIIPEGVTALPTLAFWRCRSLSEVVLPDTLVRIDNLAFAECSSLESIHIPEGAAHIGESAFWGCPLFKSIDDFIDEARNEEYAGDDDDDDKYAGDDDDDAVYTGDDDDADDDDDDSIYIFSDDERPDEPDGSEDARPDETDSSEDKRPDEPDGSYDARPDEPSGSDAGAGI